MSGFALIYRTLLGHPAFRNDAEAMAFAWLVLKASWRPADVRYKGHRISLERGQVAVSVRDMAAALDRDKAWITRLLHRLKAETMIETRVETGVTVITICNYADYQRQPDERETASEPSHDARNETEVRQRRDTEQRIEQGNKNISPPKPPKLPADVRSVMEEAGFISPPADLGLLKDWYALADEMFGQAPEKTLGDDILPTVRRVRGQLTKPPFKLKVFDAAIREKFAAEAREIERLRKVQRRFADDPEVKSFEERRAAAGGAR